MMEGGEEFRFTDRNSLELHIRFRMAIIRWVKTGNESGKMMYPTKFLPPIAPKTSWNVETKGLNTAYISTGTSPLTAISQFFTGPTRLECAAFIEAVLLRAAADVLVDGYDKVAPNPLTIGGENSSAKELSGSATNVHRVVPGDIIYFPNLDKAKDPDTPSYGDMNPTGFWTGLNTVYNGAQTYSGFLDSDKTADLIWASLASNYNREAANRGVKGRIAASDLADPERFKVFRPIANLGSWKAK